MARVDVIVQKVLIALKQEAEREITRDLILSYLNDVHEEICRDHLALKTTDTIELVAGTDLYVLESTIHKIRTIVEPDAWTERLTITQDPETWAQITRDVESGSQPLFAFCWKRNFSLHPAPSGTDEELTIYAYGLPAADLDFGADPETPREWDKCIEAGILASILGGKHEVKYRALCAEQKQYALKDILTGPVCRRHSSDELGF